MTRAMPERHTGENLAIRLKDCVDEFGLKGRVVACVHDNARNMDLAGRLCPDWQDLPCFAHTLQLCVKPVMDIPSVADVMSRARKIVGHFRHSTTMTAELRSRRVVMQLPDHDLIQDVPTRWNSSQMMLQRLVEQRRVVTDILLNPRLTGKRDRGLLLTDAEWEIAGDVASALQDLTEATNNMCSDTHVSSSEIYPVVCGLLVNSLSCSSDDSALISRVKETLRDELKRRFRPYESETAASIPVVTSLLDIRYKRLNFLTPELKNKTRTALEGMMEEVPLRVHTRDDSQQPPTKRPRFSFLITSPTEATNHEDELDAYMRVNCESDGDPLVWWCEHRQRFPTIAHVAQKLLSVPSTSVPSKRVFSKTGRLVTKARNRISHKLVDKVIFLTK
jgi:hypothetical protein